MRFAYEDTFWASTDNLSLSRRRQIVKAIKKFERACESGDLPGGLGLTHLRENIFEFRVYVHRRIIFQRTSDLIRYIFYGSHDEVKRILKRL